MPRIKTTTRAWDAAAYLETKADVAAYLDAALAEDDRLGSGGTDIDAGGDHGPKISRLRPPCQK